MVIWKLEEVLIRKDCIGKEREVCINLVPWELEEDESLLGGKVKSNY